MFPVLPPVWTTYTYDGSGRTLTVTAPDGASTTATSYAGNNTTATDAAGKWKTSTRDAFGNLTEVTTSQSSRIGTSPLHRRPLTQMLPGRRNAGWPCARAGRGNGGKWTPPDMREPFAPPGFSS